MKITAKKAKTISQSKNVVDVALNYIEKGIKFQAECGLLTYNYKFDPNYKQKDINSVIKELKNNGFVVEDMNNNMYSTGWYKISW